MSSRKTKILGCLSPHPTIMSSFLPVLAATPSCLPVRAASTSQNNQGQLDSRPDPGILILPATSYRPVRFLLLLGFLKFLGIAELCRTSKQRQNKYQARAVNGKGGILSGISSKHLPLSHFPRRKRDLRYIRCVACSGVFVGIDASFGHPFGQNKSKTSETGRARHDPAG